MNLHTEILIRNMRKSRRHTGHIPHLLNILQHRPRRHTRITHTQLQIQTGVLHGLYILIWRVGPDQSLENFHLWVPKLQVVGQTQRQTLICESHHVDEGDLENCCPEQVWAYVEAVGHESASCAFALGGEEVGVGDAFGDEVFGAGDEVEEGVGFLLEFAVQVPAEAFFTAASDVSHGDDPVFFDCCKVYCGELHV